MESVTALPSEVPFVLSVAPMMDWTDRHCRVFHRALSRRVVLYTEMVVADAVIHGPRERLLGFREDEHPLVLQVGGSDPGKLAQATAIGASYGYDAINLNVGCPSDRVQSGRFGACLMREPELVRDCVDAMRDAVDVPVTVKCRLGVDDQDLEQTLPCFLETVRPVCDTFIIHARKAWLKGLSPKENRDVPPLDYGLVREMKARYPDLAIHLNGGLKTVSDGLREAGDEGGAQLDGVMFGRAAYQDPWMLTAVDPAFGDPAFGKSRADVVADMIDYCHWCEGAGIRHNALLRHMLGLFAGQAGARAWRRHLSTEGPRGRPAEVLRQAFELMQGVAAA